MSKHFSQILAYLSSAAALSVTRSKFIKASLFVNLRLGFYFPAATTLSTILQLLLRSSGADLILRM